MVDVWRAKVLQRVVLDIPLGHVVWVFRVAPEDSKISLLPLPHEQLIRLTG
jgi:hypothetical protein